MKQNRIHKGYYHQCFVQLFDITGRITINQNKNNKLKRDICRLYLCVGKVKE